MKKVLIVVVMLLIPAVTGTPGMPHRVFGEITQDGEPVDDVEIKFYYDGEEVADKETDSDGYYDLKIPYSDDYDSEELVMHVNDTETDTSVEFEQGRSQELNLEGDFSQDNTDSNNQNQGNQGSQDDGSGSGGGGGGGLPSGLGSDDEDDNGTQDNQTMDANETLDEDNTELENDTTTTNTSTGSTNSTQSVEESQSGNGITGMFTGATSTTGALAVAVLASIGFLAYQLI
jgi:hypothetical protein